VSDALRTLPTPADSYSSAAGATVANELAHREAEGSAQWGVLSLGLLSPLLPASCSQVREHNSVTVWLWLEPRVCNHMGSSINRILSIPDSGYMSSDSLILSSR
jgi:hypothetical protein